MNNISMPIQYNPSFSQALTKHIPQHKEQLENIFFSHPLNGKLLINTKTINWFLVNKHRAIVLVLREVCERWTKKIPMRLSSLLLGAEVNVRIRKHFVLPSRMKVGRIYWQLMTPPVKLFKVNPGVITSILYLILWITRFGGKNLYFFLFSIRLLQMPKYFLAGSNTTGCWHFLQ